MPVLLFSGETSELVQRNDDLLDTARNPFYLNLLVAYGKDNEQLPNRDYDLFQNFIQRRADADKERLIHLSLNPTMLLDRASLLAFLMFDSLDLGLEASEEQIITHIKRQTRDIGWTDKELSNLLNALYYSKLVRRSPGKSGSSQSYAFVHRRFHEYFCARYVKDHSELIPIDSLAAENRWREVLVLLCEIWPVDELKSVFEISADVLSAGISSQPRSSERYKAVETLRFLRDGFKSRMTDLPNDIRELSSTFISKQLESGNPLDKKRAIESVSLADDNSLSNLLEVALKSDSYWLRETAIRSCRLLSRPTPAIEISIKKHLYELFRTAKLYRQFGSYSVNFSTKSSFHPLMTFANLLRSLTVFVGVAYIVGFGYAATQNPATLIGLIALPISFFFRDYFEAQPRQQTEEERKDNGKVKGSSASDKPNKPIEFFLGSPLITLPFFTGFIGISLGSLISANSDRVNLQYYIFFGIAIVAFFMQLELERKMRAFSGNVFSFILTVILELLLLPFVLLIGIPILLLRLLFGHKFSFKQKVVFTITSGVALWLFGLFLAFLSQKMSPTRVYDTYSGAWAYLIVVVGILGIIFIGAATMWGVFLTIRGSISVLARSWAFLWDWRRLMSISLDANDRPRTADEAMRQLNSFKSSQVRLQYARSLMKWLPIEVDTKVIMNAAGQQTGLVRDALCQLVELCEERIPKSGGRTA